MIKLYKDGNSMAIVTDCKDEREFVDEFVELLSDLIDRKAYETDWEFQLLYWLPQMTDICCKYRGYKADVEEKKVLIAGDRFFQGPPQHILDHTLNEAEKEESNGH